MMGTRATRSEPARNTSTVEVTRLLPPEKERVPCPRNCYTKYWGGYVLLLFQVF